MLKAKKHKIISFILIIGVLLSTNFLFDNNRATAAWYSTGGVWTERKQIGVDYSKVQSALTNFPMLFSVTDPDLRSTGNGGNVGQTDGGDILFTDGSGDTKLSHEIEKYDATTGELIAWVKVPYLSSTSTTHLYIYYGDDDVADQEDTPDGSNDVWDSNYTGVWHLPDGTSLATGNSVSGGASITNSGAAAIAGNIDGGADYDGSGDHSYVSTSALTTLTISGWVKLDALPSANGAILFGMANSNSGTGVSEWSGVLGIRNSGQAVNYFYNGSAVNILSSTVLSTGRWYYLTATIQQSFTARIYVNGVEEASNSVGTPFSSWSGGPYFTTSPTTVNFGSNGFESRLNGQVDELRVSNVIRSADWIRTEYNNQNSPSTFYSYGANQVEVRTDSAVSNVQSQGGTKVRGGVKFR